MISYGAVKVIKSQFPDPSLARLMQTYGDSSPMGLLWTFMGASKSYNIFTGGVECLGGFLLFIPRLTTLGALVSIGALANIFMLNMSYDVPVKLYSFHLLLMAVVLAAPDLRRLCRLLSVSRQECSSQPISPPSGAGGPDGPAGSPAAAHWLLFHYLFCACTPVLLSRTTPSRLCTASGPSRSSPLTTSCVPLSRDGSTLAGTGCHR